MSQQTILCLQRDPTRLVSCNSGLHALTPDADSYRLFIPFPSENKINCAFLLVALPGCLFRSAPRRMLTPLRVWCCAKTRWGEFN